MRPLPRRWTAPAALGLLLALSGCDWKGEKDRNRSLYPAGSPHASNPAGPTLPLSESALSRRLERMQAASSSGCSSSAGGRLFDNSRGGGCAESGGVWAGGGGKAFPRELYTDPRTLRAATHGSPPPPWTAQQRDEADAARLRSRLLLSGWRASVVDAIFTEAHQKNIDPFLIAAVAQQESSGDPRAHSWAGAQGVMQLMPGTAREMGVRDPWDPYDNVRGGVAYLKQQFDQFSDISLAAFSSLDPSRREDVHRALMAYNGGPGAAFEAMGGRTNRLSRETVEFPYHVLRHWEQFRREAAED